MTRIVYVDMDGVLCDYKTAYDRERLRDPAQPFPQSVAGFYRGLAAIDGAIDGFKQLSSRHILDVHILTAPSVYNPLSYSEKRLWVEDHLGFEAVNRLIIAPDKSLLRGAVLVDDQTEGRGQEKFVGQLLHFGSAAFPNWAAILNCLKNF